MKIEVGGALLEHRLGAELLELLEFVLAEVGKQRRDAVVAEDQEAVRRLPARDEGVEARDLDLQALHLARVLAQLRQPQSATAPWSRARRAHIAFGKLCNLLHTCNTCMHDQSC